MTPREVLPLFGIEVIEVSFRDGLGAFLLRHLVHDRDRRLGQNAEGRDDDLELVPAKLLEGEERLVFPRQEDIAHAALRERRRRTACAGIEDGHVFEEPLDEVFCLGLVAPGLAAGIFPRRKIVPPRSAGGLRIRGDDGDARLYEVVPVLDFLRIAGAHEEHNGARVGRGVFREAGLPVGGNEFGPFMERVDVLTERERDHVGLEAVDDGAGLFAGAAVRLFHDDGVAGLGLPMGGEGPVEIGIELPRRIVGDVEQLDGLGRREGGKRERQRAEEKFYRGHGRERGSMGAGPAVAGSKRARVASGRGPARRLRLDRVVAEELVDHPFGGVEAGDAGTPGKFAGVAGREPHRRRGGGGGLG